MRSRLMICYEPDQRQRLKWVFSDPERLKPGKTRQTLTEEAAEQFASLAQQASRTRARPPEPSRISSTRLVFCMFAEDIGLLPNAMFSRMLEHARQAPCGICGPGARPVSGDAIGWPGRI